MWCRTLWVEFRGWSGVVVTILLSEVEKLSFVSDNREVALGVLEGRARGVWLLVGNGFFDEFSVGCVV
ncbi:hypothetical protein M758_12G174300 [Ceratodon purpureus]|nr:hypothetical protein M758_12G174300 [Ceratodon purpureus]